MDKFDKGENDAISLQYKRPNEGGPSLSIDNRELFFTICANENGYTRIVIFFTTKKKVRELVGIKAI